MTPKVKILLDWIDGRAFFRIRMLQFDSRIFDFFKKLPNAKWARNSREWLVPRSDAHLSEFLFSAGRFVEADPDILLLPLKTELLRRNYSRKTEKAYFLYNRAFLKASGKHPYYVEDSDLIGYLDNIHYRRRLSSVTVRSILQALKFYYNSVLGRQFLLSYSIPKRERKIPEALTKDEVFKILNIPLNAKHRLLLSLCYGAGLRVSELVSIRGIDIDWKKNQIRIRQGKGKKDRFTILPKFCKEELRKSVNRSGENSWVFQGQSGNSHLHVRTAERVFESSRDKALIKKDVSIHDLRHAFAIHLLESGTSIKIIQKLLGHISVRTTEIYARITDPTLLMVQSPLDALHSAEI
ncbi:site-specific recombinase, phage integrase family [Leptospira broomii serovar Hurstbridge str. 5399]|uniref:Site-specific recombinase, phage integrase family n=1 Tax=Leptospira broomii serovar Hurstbridge str. 5399 TaxID=1049789 RepID=T0FFF5_9LEPT|nr:site-specific recombinase, phage integrase family [Leptospira broomii serovar Hurstbridge str. 5399]